jgi:hypothetical protein
MEPLPLYRVIAPFVMLGVLGTAAYFSRAIRLRACFLGAVTLSLYAIMQDQISARLCPEYFTVFHNPIPGISDPTLLGLLWGVLGAWWGGAIMGYALAIAATAGPHPAWKLRRLVKPAGCVLLATAFASALTGVNVHHHANILGVQLQPQWIDVLPPERHTACLTVACYHMAGYATAITATVIACIWIGQARKSNR